LGFVQAIKVRTNFLHKKSHTFTPYNGRCIMEMIRMGGSFFDPLVHLVSTVITSFWYFNSNFHTVAAAATRSVPARTFNFTIIKHLENSSAVWL
jgi:hypothetical protein